MVTTTLGCFIYSNSMGMLNNKLNSISRGLKTRRERRERNKRGLRERKRRNEGRNKRRRLGSSWRGNM